VEERNRGVERFDLAPVTASDGSGLPYELWRGVDVAALDVLIGKLDIPARSPAIQALWRRLITSSVSGPDGGTANSAFTLLRADALTRSGLMSEAAAVLKADPSTSQVPALGIIAARIDIGLGQAERGCESAKAAMARRADLPKRLQSEAVLITGYCAAVAGNPQAAGLAAELARDTGSTDLAGIAALDAIAAGQKLPTKGLKAVSLLQYRAYELAGGVDVRDVLDRGEPSLFAVLARDSSVEPRLRLAAGEAAARTSSIAPSALGDLYRELGTAPTLEPPSAAAGSKPEPSLHRASLFKSAETERAPLKKVRILRALLDDARRAGLYLQMLELLAPSADTLQPVPEIGWFAETGVEIGLASGNVARARQWAALGGAIPGDGLLRHWFALIDLIDPALEAERGRSLAALEDLARRGRLPPDLLHRLATVLDANDIDVPLALWDSVNKAPQPAGGHLPETGVLTALQDASKKKEFGRTVLLVMQAMGPNGAEGAHIIALGDSIRALRRAGLDGDARRLSVEALFAQWPRSVAN
jgi:hypothetical protein